MKVCTISNFSRQLNFNKLFLNIGALFDEDNIRAYSNQILASTGNAEMKVADTAGPSEIVPVSGHFSPQQNDPFSSNNFGNHDSGNYNYI